MGYGDGIAFKPVLVLQAGAGGFMRVPRNDSPVMEIMTRAEKLY